MRIMYNRRIYTSRMKRSSSRRTYKKRRTFRKSRSNRHRKTQRGGGFGGQFKSMGLGNMNFDSPEQSHRPSIHPGNTSMFGKFGNSTLGKGILGAGAIGLGAFAAKKGYDMYKNKQAQMVAQVPRLGVVGKTMNLQNRVPLPSKLPSKLPFKRPFKFPLQ